VSRLPPRTTHGRAASPGFTLFEVMAAVLVLGILYSVLATSAIEGLRAEGESRRRLEASLLADDHLIGIESGFESGDFPEVGVEEREADGYRVSVEVSPFDITPYLGEDFLEEPSEERSESLLSPPDRPEESLLRTVDVVVRWDEPEGEHEVRRRTLAYDQTTVLGLLPEEQPGGDAAGAGGGMDQSEIDAVIQMLKGGS
jgi:prepilin-type N-terminal cleavage/methylation domain-containing protein